MGCCGYSNKAPNNTLFIATLTDLLDKLLHVLQKFLDEIIPISILAVSPDCPEPCCTELLDVHSSRSVL